MALIPFIHWEFWENSNSTRRAPNDPSSSKTAERLSKRAPQSHGLEMFRSSTHLLYILIFIYNSHVYIYVYTYVYVFICWHLNSEICFCKQKGLDLDICCAQGWVWLVGQFLVLPALYIEQRIGTLRKWHMVIVIDSFPIKTAICHV